MGILELLIIAVGLSMDAFAVAICKGLSMRRMSYKKAVIIGCFFGGFQALMPLLGYILGTQFKNYITSIDHWITFVLLAIIGINMIRESRSKCNVCGAASEATGEAAGEAASACEIANESFNLKSMTLLSLATSIDALAIGVTFAFLQVNILPAISMIGIITFGFSFIGVKIGNAFGAKFESKAELAGGMILIAMGLKILLDHLGVI